MNKYQEQDEQLYVAVQSLMSGNTDAYYQIYDLSMKYIYKIIYDIVKDYHTTEDLLQETYLTIYNKIGTLQEPRKFYPWAGRIATNLTLRYIQKNKKELLILDGEEGAQDFVFDIAAMDNEEFIPESILMNLEKQRLIAEIIDGLSVEQKIVIQYFYYEEMSVSEIAEALGCSIGTVKSRLNYARKAIKQAVVDLDENKGTRLYSLNAIPLFLLLFRESVEKLTFAGAVAGATAMGTGMSIPVGGMSGAMGNARAIGGVSGTVSGSTATETVSGAMGSAYSIGSMSGGVTGAMVRTGGKTAKGFIGKILSTVGGKIVTGVLATGAIVGGGLLIHNAVKNDKQQGRDDMTIHLSCAYDTEASTYESYSVRYESLSFNDGSSIVGPDPYPDHDYDYAYTSVFQLYMKGLNQMHVEYKSVFDEVVKENASEWAETVVQNDGTDIMMGPVDITDKVPEKIEFTASNREFIFYVEKATLRGVMCVEYSDDELSYGKIWSSGESSSGKGKYIYAVNSGYKVILEGTYTCDGDVDSMVEAYKVSD